MTDSTPVVCDHAKQCQHGCRGDKPHEGSETCTKVHRCWVTEEDVQCVPHA